MKSKKLIPTILLLTLCLSVAIRQVQAQQPASASSKTDSSADAVSRVNSSTLLARVWPGRRAGFSLMPSNVYASASGNGLAVTTAAAGPPHRTQREATTLITLAQTL